MIYNTIHHDIRNNAGLSLIDWCLLESIYQLSRSEKAQYKGWCNASKNTFTYLGSSRTIVNRLNSLEKGGWIKFKDEKRLLKKTTSKYFNEVQAYILGVKKLHTRGEKVAHQGVKELHPRGEKVAPNNNIDNNKYNNIDSAKAKDTTSEIDFLKEEILELKNQIKKEKEKNSAKKEKELHVFPDNTAQKQYKVQRFNPCLTSASGGKEINKRWKTIKELKEDYEASRGIEIESSLVEAAKKSFIETGFNYHKGINTLHKLEDALFRWIDKQKKGLNNSNNNYYGKQSTDNGKSLYENYAAILYGRTGEEDNNASYTSWTEA